MELGAGRALHAMVGPEDLRPVGRGDGLIGPLARDALEAKERWPRGCQSCVSTTLRNRAGEPVDDRHDLVAARHRKRAAGAEIVLDVDDDEDVAAVVIGRASFAHGILRAAACLGAPSRAPACGDRPRPQAL